MNSISEPAFKDRATSHYTPNDAVYLKPLRLSCSLCQNKGPRKVRKNLWSLHCHLSKQHSRENYQVLENKIIELIKEGVLR